MIQAYESNETPQPWSLEAVMAGPLLRASERGLALGASGGHALRVAALSYALAETYGLNERVCERLRRAAPFHDIGKLLVPEGLLEKAGALEPDERRAVESHTVLGYELLLASSEPTLREAALLAFCHHERPDGRGYPRQRVGDQIPLAARIVSVADVFDALTNDRAYRPALREAQALELLEAGSGSQFDPEVVRAFAATLRRYPGLGERLRSHTRAPFGAAPNAALDPLVSADPDASVLRHTRAETAALADVWAALEREENESEDWSVFGSR